MADRFILGVAPVDYGPVFLLKPFRFHLTVDTLSSGCLATECKLRPPLGCLLRFRFCARLGSSLFAIPGQRGITPAFGYDTPHPGARGTLTLLISALPSAHYKAIRLPVPHLPFSLFSCPAYSLCSERSTGPPGLPCNHDVKHAMVSDPEEADIPCHLRKCLC